MRVFTDGVFDIFHFGHANGLRQAKALGNTLVVGVNSSSSAAENKNKPIMSDEERLKVIQSCKWADEVIEDVPYILDMKFVEDYKCDLVAHGDDVIIDSAGVDCYSEAQKRNMFKTFGRTKYVSTTNLVGRIMQRKGIPAHINETRLQYYEHLRDLFYSKKERKGNKIVYVDGSFDLYHAGHVSIIEEAKKNGDYLIIGLHNDKDIIKEKGLAPIMNEKERMLVLYSNKFVDEIVFDAPFYPGKEFINALCISKIYCGKDGSKYYKDVKDLVEIVTFENKFGYLNSDLICERIIDNYHEMQKKISKDK